MDIGVIFHRATSLLLLWLLVNNDSHWRVHIEELLEFLLVHIEVLLDDLDDIFSEHSLIGIHCKAPLKDLLECWALDPLLDELAKIGIPIKLPVKNIILCLIGAPSIKWILLGYHKVYTASQAPDIHFATKMILLEDQFWRRIIYMA